MIKQGLAEAIFNLLVKQPMASRDIAFALSRSEQLVYNALQRLMKERIVARKPMNVNGREKYVYGLVQRNRGYIPRSSIRKQSRGIESSPKRLGGLAGTHVVDPRYELMFEALKRARKRELEAARSA